MVVPGLVVTAIVLAPMDHDVIVVVVVVVVVVIMM